jgi:NAD(P)-dependent dehydrogenase (short-subunit alcohol dehydrogenase family)
MAYLENLFSLKNKVAVAIGAGGVLAGSMAETLAKAGAKLAIVDLNLEAAQKKTTQIVEEFNQDAIAFQMDASDKSEIEKTLLQIVAKFGKVDILLNAPGINSTTPFFEISEEEWDKIISVNLKSMFLACQIFGKQMIKQGEGGSIINVSSASSGPPLSKVFTYSISKAGVNNLTQFLAKEWAPNNIRVNAIAPGFFPAEQNRKILNEERIKSIFEHTPMKRFGDPDELAGVTVWLASEKASSFVTGSIIRVDGGFSAMTI